MVPISSMLGLMLVSKYKRNEDYYLLEQVYSYKCKSPGGRSLSIVEYINIDDPSHPSRVQELFRKWMWWIFIIIYGIF